MLDAAAQFDHALFTDLSSKEIETKGIAAENPTNGRRWKIGELLVSNICIQDSEAIEPAHRWDHGAPSTQNDKPCFRTAFWISFVGFVYFET